MEGCPRKYLAQVEENSPNTSNRSLNVNHDEIEDTLIGDDSVREAIPVISATEEDELLKNDEDQSVENSSSKNYEPHSDGERSSVDSIAEHSCDEYHRSSKGKTARAERHVTSSVLNSVENVQVNVERSNSVESMTDLGVSTDDDDGYRANSSKKVAVETSTTDECDTIDKNSEKRVTGVVTVDSCDEVKADDHGSGELTDGTGEKNPIELENENSETNERGNSVVESESMDVDEIDGLTESCGKNDASTMNKSEHFGKVTRNMETESCIIPDAIDTAVNANSSVEEGKASKKFDITPVRLEKLMDPQKLASKIIETSEEKNVSTSGRPQRQAARKAETQIKEMVALTNADTETVSDGTISTAVCSRCCLLRPCKWISSATMNGNFCLETCWKIVNEPKLGAMKPTLPNASSLRIVPTTMKLQTVSIRVPQTRKMIPAPINPLRKCAQCEQHILVEEKALAWEAMEFCNEDCLNRYQKKHGSSCQYTECQKAVPHTSMGKYAVRFGLEARQFCSGSCLEEFKKILKSCGYCQKDVTQLPDTVRVTSEDKHCTKEFCSVNCKKLYECVHLKQPLPEIEDECTVCTTRKIVEFQVVINEKTHPLCSDVCYSAFNFANNIKETDQCYVCKKYSEKNGADCVFVYHEDTPFKFCSRICMNVFILFKRKIVPCSWCKVKKYNFDMIKKTSNTLTAYLCSINCLTLHQVSINASSSRKIKCDYCAMVSNAQYHLTMSDATIRNFCSYHCVMCFQTQYSKNVLNSSDQNKPSVTAPVPLGEPKKAITAPVMSAKTINTNVITVSKPNVAIANGFLPQIGTNSATTLKVTSPLTVVTSASTGLTPVITSASSVNVPKQAKYVQQVVVRPPEPKEVANKNTQCKPASVTRSVMCEPVTESVKTQTDECFKYPALVPIPTPIYVPVPVMHSVPYPVPVPFPLPIPVPIFVPTTQKTFKALTTKIKEILEKTPNNPYEADLLLMARMVAGEERVEEETAASGSLNETRENKRFRDTHTGSRDALQRTESTSTSRFGSRVSRETSNDVSKEISNSRSGVDLEAELTSNTITPNVKSFDKTVKSEDSEPEIDRPRTRKRAAQEAQQKAAVEAPPVKTRRRQSQQQQSQSLQSSAGSESKVTNGSVVRQNSALSTDSPVPVGNNTDRPDAGMCLKYCIGVRGLKQWIIQKNEQIERAAVAPNKKAKIFNLNILKLTTEELNYLLCGFVREVRKPNGSEYAPDTIYYLCLCIQQYLNENRRVDNIFTDSTYEQFTDALDEVAVKFSEINESSQYIMTRVEEVHLWESKQLGAYSPHVLLATLLFFNTKYFNLATVEEHMRLSFSQIVKQSKRNANGSASKSGSSATNLLRYYSTQAALDAPNSRKKVYEQYENDADPLKCPVRLYEFYLSKCPESVKKRSDLFYLQPESSCAPDSPVWYSTTPLPRDVLKKILHRILMVKEVNISLLTV